MPNLTENEPEFSRHWDSLHSQPRFRPRYPNEHVVRFLLSNFPTEPRGMLRALDVGVGGGRHTKLLCELGFQTFGIDFSSEGLRHCENWLQATNQLATLQQANMCSLPFADRTFDVAIAFGVYYYADSAGMTQAIAELYRVLAPAAAAFVVLRTTDDYRYGKGARLEANTFRLDVQDTNEYGTVQHFLANADVPVMFSLFSDIQFEKTETTFQQRQSANSDWLITVRK